MAHKQGQHFAKVGVYKARFQSMTTEQLVKRYSLGPLIKEAQIAIKELLHERNYTTAGTRVNDSDFPRSLIMDEAPKKIDPIDQQRQRILRLAGESHDWTETLEPWT